MKHFTLLILFSLFLSKSYGQWFWTLDFDSPNYVERIVRDTVTNPNCSWQIGSPQKTNFNSSKSIPNAIMTDTVNPVQGGETSVFYLKHVRDNNMPAHFFALHFWYMMDGDSTDFGNIDVSPDNGHNWINLLHDYAFYNMNWMSTYPTLKGSTAGWETFDLDMSNWASAQSGFSDTILFRFIYVTDTNSTPHDGWIIDDFFLEDWIEDIPEIRNDNLISVFPSPALENLNIHYPKSTSNCSVKIFDQLGKTEYDNTNFSGASIDIREFPNGIYLLKYSDEKYYSVERFVVNR